MSRAVLVKVGTLVSVSSGESELNLLGKESTVFLEEILLEEGWKKCGENELQIKTENGVTCKVNLETKKVVTELSKECDLIGRSDKDYGKDAREIAIKNANQSKNEQQKQLDRNTEAEALKEESKILSRLKELCNKADRKAVKQKAESLGNITSIEEKPGEVKITVEIG